MDIQVKECYRMEAKSTNPKLTQNNTMLLKIVQCIDPKFFLELCCKNGSADVKIFDRTLRKSPSSKSCKRLTLTLIMNNFHRSHFSVTKNVNQANNDGVRAMTQRAKTMLGLETRALVQFIHFSSLDGSFYVVTCAFDGEREKELVLDAVVCEGESLKPNKMKSR